MTPADLAAAPAALALSLPRLLAAVMVLPLFARGRYPRLARFGFALALALTVAPLVADTVDTTALEPIGLALLVAREAFLGVLLGLPAATVFWIALGSGRVIDNQRGASVAASLGGSSAHEDAPTAALFEMAVVVLFVSCGALTLFVDSLLTSFVVWPIDQVLPVSTDGLLALATKLATLVFVEILVVAAPAIILMLVADLGFGVIGRFLPQLNVFTATMPLKSAAVAVLLAIFATTLIQGFGDRLHSLPSLVAMLHSTVT